MKEKLLPILVAFLCTFSIVQAQALNPLPKGEYPYKKVSYKDGDFVPVWSKPCRVEKSSADDIEISFPMPNIGSYTYRAKSYRRLKGNIFAIRGGRNRPFKDRPASILMVREGGVMEIYRIEAGKKRGCLVIAAKGTKFKELKVKAAANVESLDLQGLLAEITAINDATEQKAMAEKQAKADAKIAAARQKREGADLCTPIQRFVTLSGENFVSLKGKRDIDASEMEDEDIYRTNEDLPLFRMGLILPTYMDDNMRLNFTTSAFGNQAKALAEVAFIKTKLDPCFKNVNGYVASTDSGIHFYKKGKVTIAFGAKKDIGDDGGSINLVWLTIEERK